MNFAHFLAGSEGRLGSHVCLSEDLVCLEIKRERACALNNNKSVTEEVGEFTAFISLVGFTK